MSNQSYECIGLYNLNKLIEQNLIEKILHCNKPTKILIDISYTGFKIVAESRCK